MKFGRFQFNTEKFVGVIVDDVVYPLQSVLGDTYSFAADSLESFIELGPGAMAQLRERLAGAGIEEHGKDLSSLTVLSPLQPKKNVFCVGRNYMEHVEEGDRASGKKVGAPPRPIFFTKAPTSVIGPNEDIVYHACTKKLDYEVEIALVIGSRCNNVKAEDAASYIFGYTVLNDVTARDLQDEHSQWFKGKSLDTFCPIGPYVVTTDELEWPLDTNLHLWVNDELRQSMNTKDMIFDVPTTMEELTAGLTLEPGDIVATGTGPGCGFGFQPPKFLHVGDTVTLEVEGVGTLVNRVVQG